MISADVYYRRAFAAARAHGSYVGAGLYASSNGSLVRVRTFESWSENPSLGYLVLL